MKIEEKNDKLVITDFTEFEAYRIAEKIEKDGVDFYKRLAAKVVELQVKSTLELLVSEEVRHLRIFEYLLSEVRKNGEDISEDNDLLSSIDFGIFQGLKRQEELEKIITDTKKAIELAVVIESKTVAFYEFCKNSVSAEKVKKELDRIISEEKNHRGLLQDLLKSIR
ncbi:MAG: ferritin family protein [Candidatus Omnitrophica bacterium]|nr:ferritin family protein [Candidatus Omnitrophota bacterium]